MTDSFEFFICLSLCQQFLNLSFNQKHATVTITSRILGFLWRLREP